MTGPIRVSIIVPAFNDQAGLRACLQAITRQSYPTDAIEVIVVDNGSAPLLSLEGALAGRACIVRCLTPGSYAARNAGADVATGEVLAFTDADCRPDPDWLLHGVNALLAGNGGRIVGGEVTIDALDRPSAVALYQKTTGFGQEDNVRYKRFSATANLFCMRRLFETVGPFDTRLLSGGDREWCWRASLRGIHVHYEPTAVVHTSPRTDLRSAIRQSRRVVAGRKMLRELELGHIGDRAVAKLRSPWQSVSWILRRRDLSPWNRLRVLSVATIIRIAALWESVRLALGATAERR